ncbi:MAG: VOC family protein [Chloroflexi bacterium]|nr:VOC family protein [Chloroflexota bacterium]
MPRVIHFEIAADDPERAAKFYTNVFGWQMQKWEGPQEYWLITTGPEGEPGIDGGLGRRQEPNEVYAVNTIGVSSVDEYVAKVLEHGGKVVNPKHAIPGVGYQAYCQDTEGNMFGIHQNDPSAQ